MQSHYVAVDIGASSGRMIISQVVEGKMVLKEIHRFKNNFSMVEGYARWNMPYLVQEILNGLVKIKEIGIAECFVGIDTWGVDYCLLDATGKLMELPIAYRDGRTRDAVAAFQEKMSLEELYQRTGIQIQPFNTIFQLFVEERKRLEKAQQLLLIPDYLGYILTDRAVMEKTNASTMQLLNISSNTWDEKILALLGLSEKLFPPLVSAGYCLGPLKAEKFPDLNLPKATFISVASHDTASAVVGTPGEQDNWAYLSSGTWSLLGIESKTPFVNRVSCLENYTNETGAFETIRFLKNIMGMWLIQEIARLENYQFSYQELVELARCQPKFQQFIKVNDPRFLKPINMVQELQTYCLETSQKVPETPAELARCVYDNLALCYAAEIANLEKIIGKSITKLHIVGGGSNNALLNQLTANLAEIEVESGPSEATAIGNIALQMIATGELKDLATARKVIHKSFEFTSYKPEFIDFQILENYNKFIKGESTNEN